MILWEQGRKDWQSFDVSHISYKPDHCTPTINKFHRQFLFVFLYYTSCNRSKASLENIKESKGCKNRLETENRNSFNSFLMRNQFQIFANLQQFKINVQQV